MTKSKFPLGTYGQPSMKEYGDMKNGEDLFGGTFLMLLSDSCRSVNDFFLYFMRRGRQRKCLR